MKTASVNVRIQEDIKEQAEAILTKIGLPRAVAIDLFYRQIIMNNGIPFALTVPKEIPNREEMSDKEFHNMLSKAMEQARNKEAQDLYTVFDDLLQGL
ncbi:type II toxin-antitoxin system RelB/DinJ family antitoxin [Streptococcus macacae]|uniref:Addiction module antitoxin, RelB/DinJ family n=1 Tax=Streptococcus macacae NCTC 11558 TaxID=764298 RepID=G5JUP4_9STRE|nr:type II toxin-antitoxin system RelB/DinJ family antitoxin [Streptococcus macacae]EHJ52940.1 addiction module antitoxin, RelB/DinJ family [Streptococcus macacae NCTC 11558]SUN78860.1 Plasmid stabilization system antitoxin protein [Streptococcus macacae NCTC 11558]